MMKLRAAYDTAAVRFREKWAASFLFRWTLATAAGWTVGLYLSAWSLYTPALCLGGAFSGAVVGAAQAYILRRNGESPRRWIALSAVGTALGVLPAAGAAIVLTLGWGWGIALIGGIIGAGLGVGQWFILAERHENRAFWWIGANAGAGAACALLTLAPLIRGLPLGLLLGALAYGYITGRALLWVSEMLD